MFREGNENYKMKSHGQARKNEANSYEKSRDQAFSSVSVVDFQSLSSGWSLLTKLSNYGGIFSEAIDPYDLLIYLMRQHYVKINLKTFLSNNDMFLSFFSTCNSCPQL